MRCRAPSSLPVPQKGTRRTLGLLAIVAVLAASIAAGCGADGEAEPATTSSPATSETGAEVESQAETVADPDDLQLSEKTPLHEGDQSRAVKKLQQALVALGFKPGPADGVFGKKTRRALVAFQRRAGLAPGGSVDRITARAINEALAGLNRG